MNQHVDPKNVVVSLKTRLRAFAALSLPVAPPPLPLSPQVDFYSAHYFEMTQRRSPDARDVPLYRDEPPAIYCR